MNYILNSQSSQHSQPLFSQISQATSSQNSNQFTTSVRPSLLLARNQLEQKQKEKQERKKLKNEILKATLNETILLNKELKKKRSVLEKLRLLCNSLAEELLISHNEQSSFLLKLFDECLLLLPNDEYN